MMGLKTLVKVGEVDNLSDARYCAGMGVELVGFNIEPSDPKHVNPENFKTLTGWIEGVKTVGEFDQTSAEDILQTIKAYELDYIQTSSIETLNFLSDKTDLPVIIKLNIDAPSYDSDIDSIEGASYLLLESIQDTLPNELPKGVPILLGSGVSTKNLEHILSSLQPEGIALKGSPEIRPGYKDFDELADILEELEID